MVAVIWGLFYPKYFAWRYKRHYANFVKENYYKRFGLPVYFEIQPDCFFFKDKTGEGKINLSEIEKVDETSAHFFIKVSTGVTLILPKKEIQNQDELRAKFISLGLKVNDFKNWVWK